MILLIDLPVEDSEIGDQSKCVCIIINLPPYRTSPDMSAVLLTKYSTVLVSLG